MTEYLNLHMHSDGEAYQVVRTTKSGKTKYVRRVSATQDPTWKPDFHIGGFFGHTANNGTQRWVYGLMVGPELAVRLGKRGWKSKYGRHVMSDAPREFYDYNF
jgi:hypothetical protein